MESGGFHYRGDSSGGKTTALKLAASVYGGTSYLQRWRSTDNALEATAAQHSDCLLILDELAQTDPKTEKPRKDLRPWPHNALRHSAISYRVALEKDLAKIAYESGNSPAIIQRHYNGLASPQTAKAFFSITPDTAANVLLFSTQAA